MNLLPHKSWNVWGKENKARVQRDERIRDEEQKEKKEKQQVAESEHRYRLLKRRAELRNGTASETRTAEDQQHSSLVRRGAQSEPERHDITSSSSLAYSSSPSAMQHQQQGRMNLFESFDEETLGVRVDARTRVTRDEKRRNAVYMVDPSSSSSATLGEKEEEEKEDGKPRRKRKRESDGNNGKSSSSSSSRAGETLVQRSNGPTRMERILSGTTRFEAHADTLMLSSEDLSASRKSRSHSSGSSGDSDDRHRKRRRSTGEVNEKVDKWQHLRQERVRREEKERERAAKLLSQHHRHRMDTAASVSRSYNVNAYGERHNKHARRHGRDNLR